MVSSSNAVIAGKKNENKSEKIKKSIMRKVSGIAIKFAIKLNMEKLLKLSLFRRTSIISPSN